MIDLPRTVAAPIASWIITSKPLHYQLLDYNFTEGIFVCWNIAVDNLPEEINNMLNQTQG